VQKAKTQDASVSWSVLSVAAFSAGRTFHKVIALDLCNCTNFIIDSTSAKQDANYGANPVPSVMRLTAMAKGGIIVCPN
jgi:hypothetical protein